VRSGYIPRTDGCGTIHRLEFRESLQGLREFLRRGGHVAPLAFSVVLKLAFPVVRLLSYDVEIDWTDGAAEIK
jgi:hypothetical protein